MFNHQRHSGKLLITSIILFILMMAFLIAFLVELKKDISSSDKEHISFGNGTFTTCCTPDCQASGKFIKDSIDFSFKPCDNFYQFACGNWLKKNQIPESEGQYGVIQSIGLEVNKKLKDLLNQPNKSATAATDKAKIFYKSCAYDDKTVEPTAVKEINALLTKLGGWPVIMDNWVEDGKPNWAEAIATVKNNIGLDVIVGTSVTPNIRNTSKYSIFIQMPLPDQLQIGQTSVPRLVLNATQKPDIITAYRNFFIETVCHFTNSSSCRSSKISNDFEDIFALEQSFLLVAQQINSLNKMIPKGVVLGDTVFHSPNLKTDVNDYIMKVKDLNHKVPNFDWEKFLTIILKENQIKSIPDLEVVAVTDYLIKLIPTANRQSKRTIANFIGWKVVTQLMPYASPSLRKINFDFIKVVSGVQAQSKPDDACVTLATTTMGFAVTHLYAESNIGAADIEHAKNLIENIRNGFLHTLTQNNWMDKDTKDNAIKKLKMMTENVAFPLWNNNTDKVNEYYKMLAEFSEKEFLKNALSAMKVNFLNAFAKLNGPVDRLDAWPVKNPMIQNAFYYPNLNSFYLVAGIMGFPILSKNSLESLNYGGIGYIIGHEVMHGFDTTGANFDELGQFKVWWSQKAQSEYNDRANCMLNQYTIPLDDVPSLTVNGQLTLGENIADNGGIKGSYWGYKGAVKEDIRLPGLESFSGDQLFFISAAQLWCTNTRSETAEYLISNDNHSPAKYRVNIPFGNSDEFINAFQCKSNTNMNIRKKCILF